MMKATSAVLTAKEKVDDASEGGKEKVNVPGKLTMRASSHEPSCHLGPDMSSKSTLWRRVRPKALEEKRGLTTTKVAQIRLRKTLRRRSNGDDGLAMLVLKKSPTKSVVLVEELLAVLRAKRLNVFPRRGKLLVHLRNLRFPHDVRHDQRRDLCGWLARFPDALFEEVVHRVVAEERKRETGRHARVADAALENLVERRHGVVKQTTEREMGRLAKQEKRESQSETARQLRPASSFKAIWWKQRRLASRSNVLASTKQPSTTPLVPLKRTKSDLTPVDDTWHG